MSTDHRATGEASFGAADFAVAPHVADPDALVAQVLGLSPVGLAACDADGCIVAANAAIAAFLGATTAQDLIGLELDRWLERSDRRALDTPGERVFRRIDGELVWGRVARHDVRGHGEVRTLVQVEDVSTSRDRRSRSERASDLDELTGLASRPMLLDSIAAQLGASDGASCALLVVDVDRFSSINGALGHDEGDRLLEALALRMRPVVRPQDVVSRLGSDEFAVLLRAPLTRSDVLAVAERVLSVAREPFILNAIPVTATVSIGVSFCSGRTDAQSLLREADAALGKAKADGRDRCVVFDTRLEAEVLRRSRLEGELRMALSGDLLELHYQPEVDLGTGRPLGVEALARWPHPSHGLLAADTFVQLAEDAGLVADLGRWVLASACDQLVAWEGLGDLEMRINLSALQLAVPGLVDEVGRTLRRTGLQPHRLCLEVTETAVMADVAISARVLAQLNEMGVVVAIDDFGTGFSSLAHLKRLPVQILKIDKSFVDDVAHDRDSRAIVASILGLAHSLGIDVIAEGVESEAQRRVLFELGCRRAQGHLFSAALDGPAAGEWLARNAMGRSTHGSDAGAVD